MKELNLKNILTGILATLVFALPACKDNNKSSRTAPKAPAKNSAGAETDRSKGGGNMRLKPVEVEKIKAILVEADKQIFLNFQIIDNYNFYRYSDDTIVSGKDKDKTVNSKLLDPDKLVHLEKLIQTKLFAKKDNIFKAIKENKLFIP